MMLAALLIGASVHASPQGHTPALTLAFSELSPWLNREGPAYTGAYTEIIRELARRLDRKLKIAECPIKRCLAMLEAGTADLSIGIKNSPERAGYMRFLRTPYRQAVADRVFWVKRGDADLIQSYDDLLKLRIGVVSGSAYFGHFDSDARLTKEAAQGNEANLKKVLLGRIDTVPMPEDQGLVLIRKLNLEEKIEGAKFRVQDLTPRSVGVSRNSATAVALLPQMEAAMQAMSRDGTLAAIYDRHFYKRYGVTRAQIKVD